MGRRWRTVVVEGAVWWVVLFAGYLVLVFPLSGGELVLGAILSVVASCGAVAGRQVSGLSWSLPRGWWGALLRTPAAVVGDTVLLVRLLWPEFLRRGTPPGQWRTVEPAAQSGMAQEDSWPAVMGLVSSLSPGSFAVDSSAAPPTLLVHTLCDGPIAVERSARR